MKRTEPMHIRDILDRLVENSDKRVSMLEHEAVRLWPSIVGDSIARISSAVSVNKGLMTVRIASPAMRQELSMMRSHIITAINQRLNDNIIKEIRFAAP